MASEGGYAAKRLVEDKGVSLLQGHTQSFGAQARTTVDGRVILGIENFSMCVRKAAYASYPNWQQGFSVIYLEADSGRFQWYPVAITNEMFIWKGRKYKCASGLFSQKVAA